MLITISKAICDTKSVQTIIHHQNHYFTLASYYTPTHSLTQTSTLRIPTPYIDISCRVRQTETRKTHFSYRGEKNEILERSEAERGRFFSEMWNMCFSCRGINVQGANIALSSREMAFTAKKTYVSMAPWACSRHAHQARKTRFSCLKMPFARG